VSQADALQNGTVTVFCGQVLQIESAGAIAAGAAVEIAANGRVQTLASGRRIGVAFTATAGAGEFPLIQLQL
jgi:hypothetical protein